MKNKHIVLLGDSVFDNKEYVLYDETDVITQVQQAIGNENKATLLAVDGSYIEHISKQLQRLPEDSDYIFLSTGGNNLIGQMLLFRKESSNVTEALTHIIKARADFIKKYEAMLDEIEKTNKKIIACTIYYPKLYLKESDWYGLASSVKNWENEKHAIQNAVNIVVDIINEAIINQLVSRNISAIDLRKV